MKIHIRLILKYSLDVRRSWLSRTHSRDITLCRFSTPEPHFGDCFSKKYLVLDYDPAIHKEGAQITLGEQQFTLRLIELEATADGSQKATCIATGVTSVEISVTKRELLGFTFEAKALKAIHQKITTSKSLSPLFQ